MQVGSYSFGADALSASFSGALQLFSDSQEGVTPLPGKRDASRRSHHVFLPLFFLSFFFPLRFAKPFSVSHLVARLHSCVLVHRFKSGTISFSHFMHTFHVALS